MLAALNKTQATPPALVNEPLRVDVLDSQPVQDFIYADTRGPQEPAADPRGMEPIHFVDPETIWVAQALVGVTLFVAGVIVGHLI